MTAVSACHICLAVDTEIHKITECNLVQTFLALLGNKTPVWRPLLACAWCSAQLASSAGLRARCRRAQALLRGLLTQRDAVTTEDLRTLDRATEKLTLNIKVHNVYNFDSTKTEEIVKIEEIKLETDVTDNIFVGEPLIDNCDDAKFTSHEDFQENNSDNVKDEEISQTEEIKLETDVTENTIVDEPFLDKCDDANDTSYKYLQEDSSDSLKDEKLSSTSINTVALKRKRRSVTENDLPVKERNKGKEEKSNKKRMMEGTNREIAKRIIKRRVADNGFLPDFNFEEFESKYDVKIDILSKEEQMREIEEKKMSSNYTLSPFGCELCGNAFATKQAYDIHLWKHSPGAGAHACCVCGVRFATAGRARAHRQAHRLRFTCARCGFRTRTRPIAKSHFLSHTGTTHKCPHCDAVFSKYTSYLTHVRRRHPAQLAACAECGEAFVGETGLRHHTTRAHRKAAKPQHECGCGALFSNWPALDRHKASAKENKCDTSLRPCSSCGDGFSSDEALKIHEATHTPDKHPCTECNKTFVDARSLDTHVARAHRDERLKEPPRARHAPAHGLMCELCGHRCTSVSNLVAHQRSHSGARPHACPACGLRFGSQYNMQRHHKVVHLNQRAQVKCSICGKQLAHAASLKFHVNTVHLKVPPPPRQRRKHK